MAAEKKQVKKQLQKKRDILDSILKFPLPHIIIAIVVFLVYYSTLSNFLIEFDDDIIIMSNMKFLSNTSNIPEAFNRDAFLNPVGQEFYRPLQTVSYMIDTALGMQKPNPYHLTNLIIHCLTCFAIFSLFVRLKMKRYLAFSFTLIFAAHPLLTIAVAWLPARGDILLALFAILSMLHFIKYIETKKVLPLVICLLTFLLAAFSKETGLMIPVICVIYYLLNKPADEKYFSTKLDFIVLAGWLVIGLVWLNFRNHAIPATLDPNRVGIEAFLSNLRTIPELFAKFLIPFYAPPIPLYTNLWTIAGMVLIFLLIVVLFVKRQLDLRLVIFGMIWFMFFLLPTMAYRHHIADTSYSYLNHRAYLPAVGLFIILAQIIPVKWNEKRGFYLMLGGWATAAVFMVFSVIQTKIYTDPETFYTAAMKMNPNSAFIYNNRGKFYASRNKIDLAMEDFNKALSLNPDYADALSNRGYGRNNRGDYLGALEDLEKSVAIKPDFAAGWNNLGIAKYNLKDTVAALECFEKSLSIFPDYLEAVSNHGLLKLQVHEYEVAIKDYTKAISINPNNPVFYFNRANANSSLGNTSEICSDLKKASDLGFPSAIDAYKRMCTQQQ